MLKIRTGPIYERMTNDSIMDLAIELFGNRFGSDDPRTVGIVKGSYKTMPNKPNYRIGYDRYWIDRNGNSIAPKGYFLGNIETLKELYIPQELMSAYEGKIRENGIEIELTSYPIYVDGKPVVGYRWFDQRKAIINVDADPGTIRARLAHELFEDEIPHRLVGERAAEWLRRISDQEAYSKTLEINNN